MEETLLSVLDSTLKNHRGDTDMVTITEILGDVPVPLSWRARAVGDARGA